MAFVYHLCSPQMQGDVLYPLNELRTHYPDAYDRERPKYDGRESVLDFSVPFVGVTWADTVNLSALDPRLLVTARQEIGLTRSRLLERRVVAIPVDRIAGLPAAVHDAATHWVNTAPGQDVALTPPETEFTRFDPSTYRELDAVPAAHLEYLRTQAERGAEALGFVFVRHVLVAAPVDISGLDRQPLS